MKITWYYPHLKYNMKNDTYLKGSEAGVAIRKYVKCVVVLILMLFFLFLMFNVLMFLMFLNLEAITTILNYLWILILNLILLL